MIPQRKIGQTTSLQLIYCLLWRMTNSERSVWASLGPRCPALPGSANVKSSESRDKKQPWLPFYPSSCSTILCQRLYPTIDYTIQHLPMCTQIWKKQGAEKNWRGPNTFMTARLGNERLGTFLLPCSLIGNGFFLRVIMLKIRWASGLQNPLIFAPFSEREFWLNVLYLGWLKMTGLML